VLLATHDRAVIERFGGRVLSLDRGRLIDDRVLAGSEPPAADDVDEASVADGAPATRADVEGVAEPAAALPLEAAKP
jgi:hypothetical protein